MIRCRSRCGAARCATRSARSSSARGGDLDDAFVDEPAAARRARAAARRRAAPASPPGAARRQLRRRRARARVSRSAARDRDRRGGDPRAGSMPIRRCSARDRRVDRERRRALPRAGAVGVRSGRRAVAPDRRADRRSRPDRRGRARAARAADRRDGAPRAAARDDAPRGARRPSARRAPTTGCAGPSGSASCTAPITARTSDTYLADHPGRFHWDQGVRRLALGAFMVGGEGRGPCGSPSSSVAPEEVRARAARERGDVRAARAIAVRRRRVARDARGHADRVGRRVRRARRRVPRARDRGSHARHRARARDARRSSPTSISTAARSASARRASTRCAGSAPRAANRGEPLAAGVDGRAARGDARDPVPGRRSSSGSTRARSPPAISRARSTCGARRARRRVAARPRPPRVPRGAARRARCAVSVVRRGRGQERPGARAVVGRARARRCARAVPRRASRAARRSRRSRRATRCIASDRRRRSCRPRSCASGGPCACAMRCARTCARSGHRDSRRGRPARAARCTSSRELRAALGHRRRAAAQPPAALARPLSLANVRAFLECAGPGVGAGRARPRRARRRGSRSSDSRRAVRRREAGARAVLREVLAAQLRDPARELAERLRRAWSSDLELRGQFPVGVFGDAARSKSICACSRSGARSSGRSRSARRPGSRSAARRRRIAELRPALELALPGGRSVRLVGQTELLLARGRPLTSRSSRWSARPRRSRRHHLRGALDHLVLAAAGLATAGHAHVLLDPEGACAARSTTRRGRRPMRARTSPRWSASCSTSRTAICCRSITSSMRSTGKPPRRSYGDATPAARLRPDRAASTASPRRPTRDRDRGAPARPARRSACAATTASEVKS